jgi:hypothetical protein
MAFDDTKGTYDGTTIVATYDTGSINLGVDWRLKSVPEMYISILPGAQSSVQIYASTDVDDTWTEVLPKVSYSPLDFANLDFDNIDFVTNYNPQPFKRRIRLKKIGSFKIRLYNGGLDSATVLSVTAPIIPRGKVKER